MSISSSLSNAMSGLTAASRMADVVASNTANAMTEGYARRDISLSSRSLGNSGAGVQVDGVSRVVDETLLQDRRLADAATANATTRSDFYSQLETQIGDPGDTGSLSTRLSNLESALVEASSMPESDSRLTTVVKSAGDLVDHLNNLSDGVQQTRMNADSQIADQVDFLNKSLQQIDDLNATILAQRASGQDVSALQDQRQVLVDKVSEIVPVRQVMRDHDQVALFTTGGAILLEGNAAEIGFTQTGVITAGMTQENGALSGLTINGMAISSSDTGVMGGGSLGALFAVRDEMAPEAQSQLDAVARDLIERFADPSVDPTLNAGDAGLFTDKGAAFDPANEVGLASRIRVNAIVDPEKGGAVWHLRDGLNAASPGTSGDATLLLAYGDALSTGRVPVSGNFSGNALSASGLASDLLSQVSGARQSAETVESFHAARSETLNSQVLANGVDTDYEMQRLMQVEQAYSANAKVIQVMDELLQTLLGL